METYIVYIIESLSDGDYYKGITTDIERRLMEHNGELSTFTSGKGPWKLVYKSRLLSKQEAIKEEKRIKKLNRRSLSILILSSNNELRK